MYKNQIVMMHPSVVLESISSFIGIFVVVVFFFLVKRVDTVIYQKLWQQIIYAFWMVQIDLTIWFLSKPVNYLLQV